MRNELVTFDTYPKVRIIGATSWSLVNDPPPIIRTEIRWRDRSRSMTMITVRFIKDLCLKTRLPVSPAPTLSRAIYRSILQAHFLARSWLFCPSISCGTFSQSDSPFTFRRSPYRVTSCSPRRRFFAFLSTPFRSPSPRNAS